MKTTEKVILLGPAFPYRGGIAETQHKFHQALIDQGINTKLWTFTKLYPSFLFPGKTQFDPNKSFQQPKPKRIIHAYNPLQWRHTASELAKEEPTLVIFRLWTPLLIPCWNKLAHLLPKTTKKIAWVDNWIPHETKAWDQFLLKKFVAKMDAFSCLSTAVEQQISSYTSKPVWGKQHPVPDDLPPALPRQLAQKKMGADPSKKNLLFFGLIRAYKGLDLLIKAMKQHPNKTLWIVGESYEDFSIYQKLIEQNGLQQRVRTHLQFVSQEEVCTYFSGADAVVLPYKTATQSGVLALAYFYETPLLVTHHPGLAEVVKNDQTGCVVAPTSMDLAKGIENVCTPSSFVNYKKQLNKHKNNYSWQQYAKEWIQFSNHV